LIKVDGNEIFIVEGHTVYVYSEKDLKLIRKIGKQGTGPGEFQLDPNRTAAISIFADSILVESRYKAVYFTRDGKFIREMKKHPGTVQMVPIGKNYVVYKILYGPNNQNYWSLNIYDSRLNNVKELYRQKFFTFEDKTLLVGDAINFFVHRDRVYVEESPDGFIVEVFDAQGNKVDRIEKEYEKVKVTTALKEEALEHFLSVPAIRQAISRQGRDTVVNDLKRRSSFFYPDYLPPIKDIKFDGKVMYVKTLDKKDKKEKYLAVDLKGKVLNEVYLPWVQVESFFNLLQGDKKFYAFHNNKFYFMKRVDVDDDEEWEVRMEDIK
jgi:DNA-binding beta-propeller fold protein YncE